MGVVTLVRFLKSTGAIDREVEAPSGTNLLELAQANGQPLEGACEGAMACSTCHVLVDKGDFTRLPPPSEEEEDLLDLAAHATRYSRLSCQLAVPEGEPFTVTIPPSAYNFDR